MTNTQITYDIALIRIESVYNHNSDDYDFIARNISEWSTVTDEEYRALQKYLCCIDGELKIVHKVNTQQFQINLKKCIELSLAEKAQAEEKQKRPKPLLIKEQQQKLSLPLRERRSSLRSFSRSYKRQANYELEANRNSAQGRASVGSL